MQDQIRASLKKRESVDEEMDKENEPLNQAKKVKVTKTKPPTEQPLQEFHPIPSFVGWKLFTKQRSSGTLRSWRLLIENRTNERQT
jgi:hypothetical protein